MQLNTVYVLCSLMKQMWCSRIEHARGQWEKKGAKYVKPDLATIILLFYGISGFLLSFWLVALVLPDCE